MANSLDTLLSRLDKVKKRKTGHWMSRCPAHDDRGPSLSIRETDERKVLIHCFAGCTSSDVLAAVGMEYDALFPDDPSDEEWGNRQKSKIAVYNARKLNEDYVAAYLGASMLASGQQLSENDHKRLDEAIDALTAHVRDYGASHLQSLLHY